MRISCFYIFTSIVSVLNDRKNDELKLKLERKLKEKAEYRNLFDKNKNCITEKNENKEKSKKKLENYGENLINEKYENMKNILLLKIRKAEPLIRRS